MKAEEYDQVILGHRAFIALRLHDVASFNGCHRLGASGTCVDEHPHDPVEWCRYCVQGAAARLLELLAERRRA